MITLGKQKFVVPTPRHMRTWALQQRLIPVAGDIASALVSVIGKTDLTKLKEADITAALPTVMPQIGRIFGNMPPGELEQLTRILLGDPKEGAIPLEVATCDDIALFAKEGDAFDTILRGRTWDTWKLVTHALEVWYPDFFDLVRPFLAIVQKGKGSEASPTSPTPGQPSA